MSNKRSLSLEDVHGFYTEVTFPLLKGCARLAGEPQNDAASNRG